MATLASKPVTWFKTEKQVREVKDTPELRELGKSLLERQLQPVIARNNGVLVAGHRRLRAAILVGKPTLDVIITDENLSDSQVKQIQMVENIHRADLSGYEKYLGCAELMCCNPAWSMKDLAEALHLDPSMVTRLLSPSKCVAAWQEALKHGTVGVSDCYAASKLQESEQAGLLALKLSGASRDQIEAKGRKSRTVESTVKVSRVRCPVASGATVVVSGPEMSLDGLIEALGQALDAAKKASKEGIDVKTLARVMADKAKV